MSFFEWYALPFAHRRGRSYFCILFLPSKEFYVSKQKLRFLAHLTILQHLHLLCQSKVLHILHLELLKQLLCPCYFLIFGMDNTKFVDLLLFWKSFPIHRNQFFVLEHLNILSPPDISQFFLIVHLYSLICLKKI